jgi:hypothetical protein
MKGKTVVIKPLILLWLPGTWRIATLRPLFCARVLFGELRDRCALIMIKKQKLSLSREYRDA